MAKAVAEEYKSSLADLNFNSKPHINMLTMLAEENISNAFVIVQTIVDHIQKTSAEMKLPGFYLVDSIIKNVGKDYVPLFCQHIVALFSTVFEKVDENTRSLLFKLRQTWNGPLPNKILYELDLQIRKMDPAWPITAKPSTKGIHINPKFLTGSTAEKKEKILGCTTAVKSTALKTDGSVLQKHSEVLKQLCDKKDQLNERQAALRSMERQKLEISRKKMRMLAQSFANQNFKPSLRDPRMVKINKVPPSIMSKKAGSVSLLKKIETKSSDCLVPNVAEKTYSVPEKQTVKPAKSAPAVQNNLSVKPSAKNIDQISKTSLMQTEGTKGFSKHDPDDIYEKFKADTFSSNSTSMRKVSPSKHNISSEINSGKNDCLLKCDKSDSVQSISNNESQDKNSNYSQTNNSASSVSDKSILLQTKLLKENAKASQMGVESKNAPFTKKIPHKKGNIKNDQSTKNFKKNEKQLVSVSQNLNKSQSDSSYDATNVVSSDVSTKTLKRSSETCDTMNSDNGLNESPVKKQRLTEKQNVPNNNDKRPPVLFGNEDQDQRRSKLQILDPNIQGWAEYKAVHPDEFGSPPSREHPEGRFRFRRLPSVNMNRFHSFDHDRGSRFRFQRGRFSGRYSGRRPQLVRGPRGRFSSPYRPTLLPHVVIEQAEDKFRSGEISKEDFLALCHSIRKVVESTIFKDNRQQSSNIQSVDENRLSDIPTYKSTGAFDSSHDSVANCQKDEMKSANTTFDPCTKYFTLDGKVRTIQFMGDKAFVIMDNKELKQLSFKSDPRNVFIEGLPEPILMSFDGKEVEFVLNGNKHSMKFGTPARELYIDKHPYEAHFGGPPFSILLDGHFIKIRLSGPPPQVIVSDTDSAFGEHQENYKSVPKTTQHFDKNSSSLNTDVISAQDIDMRVTPGDIEQPSSLDKVPADVMDVDWRILPGMQAEIRDQRFNVQLETAEKNNLNMQQLEQRILPVMQVEMRDQRFSDQLETAEKSNLNIQQPEQRPQLFSDKRRITEIKWHDSPVPVSEYKSNVDVEHSSVQLENNNLKRNFETYNSSARSWREKGEHYIEQQPTFLADKQESNAYANVPEYYQSFERKHDGFSEAPRGNWRGMAFSWRTPTYYGGQSRGVRIRAPRYNPQIQRNLRPRLPDWRFDMQNQEPQQNVSFIQDLFKNMPGQPTDPITSESSLNLTKIQESIAIPAPEGIIPVPVPGRSTLIPALEESIPTSAPVQNVNEIPIETENRIAESSEKRSQVDVEGLLEKLMAAGIISLPVEEPLDVDKDSKTENDDDVVILDLESDPELMFKTENLKVHRPGVISALHQGTQCCSCGMRYKDVQSQHYRQHLDWHFRLNRREKEGTKKPVSKRWNYEVDEWIQFEEFVDCEERTPSFFDLQAEKEPVEPPTPIIPSIPATGDISEFCSVCGEQLQLFWVQDEEEWHLKNAVRHDNEAYHPGCYEDFEKAQQAQNISDVVSEEDNSAVLEEVKDNSAALEEVKDNSAVLEEVKETMQWILDEIYEKEVMEEISLLITSVLDEVEKLLSFEQMSKAEEILEGKPGVEEIIGLITESESESESNLNLVESKMVVMQSGGITLKVKAESLQSNSSANASETDMDCSNGLENRADEFRPPTPDPRFRVMPPVSKGSELSGLCCIM